MNIYRLLVLAIADKHLKQGSSKIEKILSENHSLKKQYVAYEKRLKSIYKNTKYWHGTGLYQYTTTGKSKYQKVSKTETFNVLKSIIEMGGLKPHPDPWVKTFGKHGNSVSTTKFRIYGRMYSELHMNEKSDLQLTYGDRLFFAKFFIHYTFASAPIKVIFGFIYASFKKMFATKGPLWARTINSNIKSKGNAMSDFINIVGTQKSNIANNFGILIGIKSQGVVPAEMNKYIALLETRSIKKISIGNFSHIEVPLTYVPKIEKLVRENKILIPVIPLEFGEIYHSKYTIKQLL